MSLSGQLLRGLKWYKFRNVDRIYPKEISSDPHKMGEINFYLDFVNTHNPKEVHKILEQVMIYDLSNKPTLMAQEAEKLLHLEIVKNKSKEKK